MSAVAEAIGRLRSVGSIRLDDGSLRVKLTPGADGGESIRILREGKAEAVAWLEHEAIEAVTLLNLTGTRRLPRAIGLWLDLHEPEVRAALAVLGYGDWPVVMLDSPEAAGYQDRDRRCPVRAPGESFDAWRRRAKKGIE